MGSGTRRTVMNYSIYVVTWPLQGYHLRPMTACEILGTRQPTVAHRHLYRTQDLFISTLEAVDYTWRKVCGMR